MNNRMLLIKPSSGETAYDIAGNLFIDLWKQVTGKDIAVVRDNDGIENETGDLVIIGSDAVNILAHRMIKQDTIKGFDIRYGSDDYQLFSVTENDRCLLFIVGGCGRSTIYAVYDFFKRRANVRYFWDGDRISRQPEIDITQLNVAEKPHFQYRGIRYFAHRGLHRFQAEHWNFADWRREIDWLMKKRLNMFMLRIGLDDLFQRAFPDVVAYPPEDGIDPEATLRSYNDRTSFRPLKERGILREKVLNYAFERGLMHPEDTGTITHWYSRTPKALLEYEEIDFTVQKSDSYNDASGLVWNIHDPKSWERYWKLTETHIREFGKPELFHTIGLAERSYGASDKENLKLKIWTLMKINQVLREHYPDAPLLVASWDFSSTWKSSEVCELIKKFDPTKTIILDYTADADDASHNIFTNWDIVGKMPWIFGIFQGLLPNNDLRGDFSLIEQRLRIALDDEACKGMVYWSEFAHGDAFMPEYFAANAWDGSHLDLSGCIKDFCLDRYPKSAFPVMYRTWTKVLTLSQTRNWTRNKEYPMREINSLVFFNILTSPWLIRIDEAVIDALEYHSASFAYILANAPEAFERLPDAIEKYYQNEFMHRDIVDMARIALSRVLHAMFMQLAIKLEQWRSCDCPALEIENYVDLCGNILELTGELLSQHEDFSLYASLLRLRKTGPVNPHSEQTLKGNTENSYCRSFFAEFFPLLYMPEFKLYERWIKRKLQNNDRSPWVLDDTMKAEQQQIRDKFYQIPLEAVASAPGSAKQLRHIIERISDLVNDASRLEYSNVESNIMSF